MLSDEEVGIWTSKSELPVKWSNLQLDLDGHVPNIGFSNIW